MSASARKSRTHRDDDDDDARAAMYLQQQIVRAEEQWCTTRHGTDRSVFVVVRVNDVPVGRSNVVVTRRRTRFFMRSAIFFSARILLYQPMTVARRP